MQKTNKKKYSVKDVIDDMRKGERRTFVLSLDLAIVAIAVFAVALFDASFLIILIPFILIPWVYASLVMVLDKQANDDSGPRIFFRSFGLYFHRGIFGCYRLFRNFLISLLSSILLSFIAGLIFVGVVSKTDPAFFDILQEASFYINNLNFEGLQNLLSAKSSFTDFLDLINIVELASFFLIFNHNIGVYGLNAIFRTSTSSPSDFNANRLFSKIIRTNFKEFYKMYFSYLWPMLVIEVLGFAGGFFLSRLIAGLSTAQNIIFGIGVGVALISLCYGYYVHSLHLMQEVFGKMVISFLYKSSQEAWNDPKFQEELSEEEKENMKKQLDEMSEILEGKESEKKDDQKEE